MKPVAREEIVDHVTYEDLRPALRAAVLAEKAARRVHLGSYLTFLFETRQTVRYQVQEMMRVEKIVREADIRHELDTYNDLLGGPGELGCTLLIEIEDSGARADKLSRWLELPAHLYARVADGARVRARYDPRQVGDTRLSSVQYLKFPVAGRVPVALGCDLADPDVGLEVELDRTQRDALASDLAG